MPLYCKALAVRGNQSGPSERQLAAELGISHVALIKARNIGRCGQSKDVDVLRRELAENTNAALQRPKPGHKPARSARTAHHSRYEAARAREMELRGAVLAGELVPRARATAALFELGRRQRDHWLQWPARVAAQWRPSLGPRRTRSSRC
jgi:hypothetical protein